MKIVKAKDYAEASLRTADYIGAQVLLKPHCTIGLATGSTPLGIYKELVRRHDEEGLSFSQVTSLNLDEYFGLGKTHPQSYYYFMHHNFIDLVDIEEKNTHLPNGMASDLEAESRRYDAVIHKTGPIDIQLLGIGGNGHIGFNEPRETMVNNTHVVDLMDSTIESNSRFFESPSEVPRQAITMGIGTILRARKIVMMITGKEKADALKKTVLGPITPLVPASLLRLHHDFTVVADAAALSLVKGKV